MDISTLQSPQIDALAKAMMAVQSELAPVTKDAKNTFVGNRYATLTAVVENCRDALERNGIWLSQIPVPAPDALGPNHLALMTRLYHLKSGQWQASILCTPLPKADPQGMGSALTYCRRYAICAMLGILTEDDDANSASRGSKQTSPARQPAKTPRMQKGTSGKQSQGEPSQNGSNRPYFDFDSLPQLDGVEYQIVTGNDGRDCVLALGNTFAKKEILQGAGFKWSQERKCWWRYGDVA